MNTFQKPFTNFSLSIWRAITIASALLLLATCEEPEIKSPSQGNLDPESWAPVYPKFEFIDVLTRKISWRYLDDTRIDGFKIDRKQGENAWEVGHAILEREEREWIDSNFAFDTTITYSYRIYAHAGAYQSEARILSFKPEFPAPTNFTVEKESDISFRLEWEKTGFGEQGYIIDRKTGNNDWETAIATLNADQLFFVDSNAIQPKSTSIPIEYRLTAFFENIRTNPVYGAGDVTLQSPYNPLLSVTLQNEIKLSWSFNKEWHHGFKIDRRVNNGLWTNVYAIVNKDSRSFIDVNVDLINSRYAYRIYSYHYDYESGKVTSVQIGKPEMLTGDVTGIGGGMATFHGNILNSGGITYTQKGFVYGQSPNPTLENNIAEVEGTAPFFNIQVSGLESLKTYYVRSFIVNQLGTFYGNEVSFLSALLASDFDGIEGTVSDIEGHTYSTITIAQRWWMTENLKTIRFSNGDMISDGWLINVPSYAWYDNDTLNKHKYGALYNWYAVNDPRGLCPAGWRIPEESDWFELFDHLMFYYELPNNNELISAGNAIKSCRQQNSPLGGNCNTNEHPRWDSFSGHYGTDLFGFSALPGGYSNNNGFEKGEKGYWWTSSGVSPNYAASIMIRFNFGLISRIIVLKNYGLSVRCIKDYEP